MIITRFKDIVDSMHKYTFHILGCGAIGSSVATQLARSGAEKFVLYDMDKVDVENIGVSQYLEEDIGKDKVYALAEQLKSINLSTNITTCYGEFSYDLWSPDLQKKDIVILGFDSMSARLEAVRIVCNDASFKPLFIIDGRMGAEHYQQYTIKNPTVREYKGTWYSDEEGSTEPCNAKATSYCSNMSGSFIVNTIRKLITNQPYHKKLNFHFPTMNLDKSKMIV